MSIKFSHEKLSTGHVILKMTTTGDMTSADIDTMRAEIYPGKRSYDLPQLIVSEPPEGEMKKEFRERLTEVSPKRVGAKFPVAIVLNKPLMRTALEFILKVLRYETARVVATEAEGRAWLEKQAPLHKEKKPPYV